MTLPMNDAALRRFNVGPVKPWVQAAADYIGTKFNLKTIGGWRRSDPFPDHPSGHALDYMITSSAQGDAIAADLVANARALGLKYLIWNRRTWNTERGTWAPYTSTSNPHTDHVHATFNPSPGTAFGALGRLLGLSPGAVTPVGDQAAPDTCAWNLAAPKLKADVPFLPDVQVGGQSFCVLSKVQVRLMFSILVTGAGISIGMLGVIVLVAYGLKASGASKAITDVAKVIPGGRAVKKAAAKGQ